MREQESYLFEAMLGEIAANHNSLPEKPLTGFLAMVGEHFNHELMVVGRAPNGFRDGVLPSELLNPVYLKDFSRQTLESVSRPNGCPMRWVTERWGAKEDADTKYNTKRSAFWRVIRSVVDKLALANVEAENWPSVLLWSNLYKVAPADGGNPLSRLCSLQESQCVQLLRAEIENYKPKRVLLLTGFGWAKPFLEGWTTVDSNLPKYTYVECIASFARPAGNVSSKIVVAAHPQGKKETLWVQEVLAAFK